MARLMEMRAIERIPADERHGKVRSLLSLWFISNAQVLVVTFGIAVVGLGLSLPWAIAAIVIGVIAGTPIMAYHSAQGPRLGVPQMIQSRAQFGLIGGIIPTLIAFVLYLAFVILGSTVLGPATAAMLHISTVWGIVVFNVACLIIAWVVRQQPFTAWPG
jgi:NCS1 family nucleobase:cation symporter-1